MEPVVHLCSLSKAFRGGPPVLDGFDLKVDHGEVFGLIGRNGSGKTTALRILMGLLRADHGIAHVLGQDLWQADREHRQRVAYVSQSQQLPDWLSMRELAGTSSRLYRAWSRPFFAEILKRWNLPPDRPVASLSGGNQRLAAIALALSTRPEVLVLDEPAAGLDPIARRDLNQCLIEVLGEGSGCTIVLSTHLLADLERLATRVGIIEEGRLVAEGAVEEWQRTMRRLQIVFAQEQPPRDFSIPGAIRSRTLGPVVSALARIEDDSQLDGIRAIEGARVYVFPLTLEELFVDWFQGTPTLETHLTHPSRPHG